LSDAELAADELAQQGVTERLPRIRAAATAWGASVSAITALFGAGIVVNADSQVRALKPGWAVTYGVLAALALAAAGAAIYLAAPAAEARPVPMPKDVRGRATAIEELFQSAVRDLKASRVCTAAAVVLLMASIGVRWYAPTTLPPSKSSSPSVASTYIPRTGVF
jgi:hypothetical protein